jgi:hypothetical protein|nr:MAG TPA: Putative large adhesion protein (Lap) domain, adhesion protein, RTX [Caudoviricetes sp.]
MFKNVRYVDPKLYLPYGEPDFNPNLTPASVVQFSFNYGPEETPFGKVPLKNGLVAYDSNESYGNFSSLADAQGRTAYNANTVIISQINSDGTSHVSGYSDYFRQRFLGYIYCPEDGTYNFRTDSDDGSVVGVDGVQVAHSGASGNNQQDVTLTKGYHMLEYYHVEQGGGQNWYLYWKTPSNSSWVLVPPASLFYAEDRVWHPLDEISIAEHNFLQRGKLNGAVIDDETALDYQIVNGVDVDVPVYFNPEGRTIDDPVAWSDVLSGGSYTFVSSSSFPTQFIAMKLKSGVNYRFDSATDYDDMLWFYDTNKSQVGGYDDPHFNYTPSADGIYYLEVGGYNRNRYGTSTLTISPTPEVYNLKRLVADTGLLLSTDSVLVRDNNTARSYSIWYKYGTDIKGTLLSLDDGTDVSFVLYFKSNALWMYDTANGATQLMTFSSDKTEFQKRDKKDFCHFLFMYDPTTQAVSFKFEGQNKLTTTMQVNVSGTRIMLGDSVDYSDYQGILDGRMKAFRIYDKVLSDDEAESVRAEFDTTLGPGLTYTNPLGNIPKVMEDDTVYLIRRYNDDTKLRLDFSQQTATKIGIFGFPKAGDLELNELPAAVSTCPWLNDEGEVVFEEVGANTGFYTETLKKYDLRNLHINRNASSSNYIFDINISDKYSIFRSKNCRWSSADNFLDDSQSNEWNPYACKYVRYKNILGKFDFSNCDVMFTNDYNDAFRVVNCERADINDVEIYSSSYNSDSWNGFCFSFIRGSDAYDYDDINSYTGSSYINYLTMKNVKQHIRIANATSMNGIVLAVDCRRVYMDNVSSITENPISVPSGSPRWRNGVIHIRTGYDNYFNNISVQNDYCRYIPSHAVVELRLYEQDASWTSGSPNVNRLMQDISVILSEATDNTNSMAERTYYTTSSDWQYLYQHTALAILGYGTPQYKVTMAKDIYVKSPGTKALSLRGVKAVNVVTEGVVSLLYASADIESIDQRDGYNAISVWRQGEAFVKKVNVTNYNGGEVVILNDIGNCNIVIDECNVPLNSISYGTSGSYRNDAMIYCKNTVVANGFFLKGLGQAVLPVQFRRTNGAEVSLRLSKFNTQNEPFRIPPVPSDGIEKALTAGVHKLTIHFAHGEEKSFEDFVEGAMYVEVATPGFVYDSRLDGKWVEDTETWNEPELKKFKFELTFNMDAEEKAYVRVYYNIDTKANGGLFMDPKFDWE